MKLIGKFIGAFVGIALFLALFSLLSWPVFVLATIGLWYYTKKDPNPKFQKIAAAVLVFSFFGIALGFTDGSSGDTETEEPKTEEAAEKESVEPKEEKKTEKKVAEKESVEEPVKEVVVEEPAPAPTPEPAPAPEEDVDISEFISPEMVMSVMQSSFDGTASIRYDSSSKMFIFTVLDPDVQAAIYATANGIMGRSDWDKMVNQFVDLGGSAYDTLGSGYSVVMENPGNPDNYLFLIYDGVLIYNFADEL